MSYKFVGFKDPDVWWGLPNTLINILPQIKTVSELKVLLYVLHHATGFGGFTAGEITIDEFAHGVRSSGKRRDDGTGLSSTAIRAGIRQAIDDGFITMRLDGRDEVYMRRSFCPVLAPASPKEER